MSAPSSQYESKFRTWDQQSWVRAKPRRAANFVPELSFFSEDLSILFTHSAIIGAPSSIKRDLLIQQLYIYLKFTVWLELGPVNEVCDLLRREDFLPWLPAEMKADAFKIYVEEGGHAEMSHTLIREVQAYTQVSPAILPKPAFLDTLDELVVSEEPEYHSLIKLLFVIISETLITGTLNKLPNDAKVQEPIRGLVKDHANDESRHHLYFRTLFEYLWPRLPRALRLKMGQLLPEMIMTFLAPDRRALLAVLELYREQFDAPSRVVEEIISAPRTMAGIEASARPTLIMLRQNGVFDEPRIKNSFEQCGFHLS